MYVSKKRLSQASLDDNASRAMAFFDRGIEELATARPNIDGWLWYGYLAPRQITLLTAMWKTGKTTFIAGLLAKLKAGGDYCGQQVRAGRALDHFRRGGQALAEPGAKTRSVAARPLHV